MSTTTRTVPEVVSQAIGYIHGFKELHFSGKRQYIGKVQAKLIQQQLTELENLLEEAVKLAKEGG